MNIPWSSRLKVLGICYQEKVYSGCRECVACCVLADELLRLVLLNIHRMCVDGHELYLLGPSHLHGSFSLTHVY